MKRVTLGIATALMFGTLFSMAMGYAVWQLVQLNALLSLSPLPEPLVPIFSKPDVPNATLATLEVAQPEPPAASERMPALAAEQHAPTAAPGAAAGTEPIERAVYVTVESVGAAVEVSVVDKP